MLNSKRRTLQKIARKKAKRKQAFHASKKAGGKRKDANLVQIKAIRASRGGALRLDKALFEALKQKSLSLKAPATQPEPAPELPDFNAMTVSELREQAKAAGMSGYSKMRKADLVETLTNNWNNPGGQETDNE